MLPSAATATAAPAAAAAAAAAKGPVTYQLIFLRSVAALQQTASKEKIP